MKGRPVDQLVYEHMFPRPRAQDPQNFHALLQRHLILEVRQEVHSYYGHLDTAEAKYPGLDYTHHIHRTRLSRWQWHRRMFRAFDALRLTASEISSLTKWEGTRWAKLRYEREQNTIIQDTTADGMLHWSEHQRNTNTTTSASAAAPDTQGDDAMAEVQEADSDGELESVGIALNEQLRERVAARNAGDLSLPVDEAWEQWFKNAVESGDIADMRERIARVSPQDLFPRRFIDAARAGAWYEVPDFLQEFLRDSLLAEDGRLEGRSAVHSPSASPPPNNFSPFSPPLSSAAHDRRSSASPSAFSGLRIPSALQSIGNAGTPHAQSGHA